METSVFDFIILKIMPFIRFSVYYTGFRGDKYHEGYFHLQPGMMIGTIDYKKATGLLIPKVTGGILSHIAYCHSKRDPEIPDLDYLTINPTEGHGDGLEVVEMTHMDFTFSDFFDICKESERVIIFDCVDWDEVYKKKMSRLCLEYRNHKYEAGFRLDHPGFLYCSGLVYEMDLKANGGVVGRLDCSLDDLMGLGRPYISPDGILCSKNVKVVWDSKKELIGMTGKQVREIVFKKKKVL